MGSEQDGVGRSRGPADPSITNRVSCRGHFRPPSTSFLKAEEDEFERLFTELLYASHSRAEAEGKGADYGGVTETKDCESILDINKYMITKNPQSNEVDSDSQVKYRKKQRSGSLPCLGYTETVDLEPLPRHNARMRVISKMPRQKIGGCPNPRAPQPPSDFDRRGMSNAPPNLDLRARNEGRSPEGVASTLPPSSSQSDLHGLHLHTHTDPTADTDATSSPRVYPSTGRSISSVISHHVPSDPLPIEDTVYCAGKKKRKPDDNDRQPVIVTDSTRGEVGHGYLRHNNTTTNKQYTQSSRGVGGGGRLEHEEVSDPPGNIIILEDLDQEQKNNIMEEFHLNSEDISASQQEEQRPVLRKAKSFPEKDLLSSKSVSSAFDSSCHDSKKPALGRCSEGALLQGSNRDGRLFDTGDKLFFDLLDDLDNITSDNPSMRRRQKARDIFSDWLFNEQQTDSDGTTESSGNNGRSSQVMAPRNRKSFHEYLTHSQSDGDVLTGNTDINNGDERLSRAGSEPSQRKSGRISSPTPNQNKSPKKVQAKPSISEQDAVIERRLREQYLAARAGGCQGNENQNGHSLGTIPKQISPLSRCSRKSIPSPVLKLNPPGKPRRVNANDDIIFSPMGRPGGPRGCSAKNENLTDTLEILNSVKFRKKNPRNPMQSMNSYGDIGLVQSNNNEGEFQMPPGEGFSGMEMGEGILHPYPHTDLPNQHQRNIYKRWKIRGRPLSLDNLSETIYSDTNTVVYSKRRSFPEEARHPEDLFSPLEGEERPPNIPEQAWNTLRQIPSIIHADASLLKERDQYGSIRYDTVKQFVFEDDADSGYHTGESTLRGGGGAAAGAGHPPGPPPPGERTLSREDLRRRIESFNDNQHGLLMTLRQNSDTFQGFIRVYMSLMRPISMSLTARPPSIYDILTPEPPESSEYDTDTQLTSFYLPKDTTKVIHITSDTTAQEVIRALLQKFRITDNPRKFALYERQSQDEAKSSMRRLSDGECPLALCLSWAAEGLNFHRFILQENDTGEIMWEAFSYPELDNFLRILAREEGDYVQQVKAKYQLMKIQIKQHLKHLEQEQAAAKEQEKLSNDQEKLSKEQAQLSKDSPEHESISNKDEQEKFPNDERTPVFV